MRTLHTRVIVSCWKEGDLFVRETVDQGAKFRDEADIQRVTNEIQDRMRKHYAVFGDLLRFRVGTREAG